MHLTEEHCEILCELTNIAIGRASAVLADLLGQFVVMTVPKVEIVDAGDVGALLWSWAEAKGGAVAVEQAFSGDMAGQAVLLHSREGVEELGANLLLAEEMEELGKEQAQREVMLEIGNMLISATAGRIAELLGATVAFAPPRVLEGALPSSGVPRSALIVNTKLTVESSSIEGRIAIVQDPECGEWLPDALERTMEGLLG